MITMMMGKKKKKLFWLPAISPVISVIISTLIVYLTRADEHGVKIIRLFKGGLNPSSLNQSEFNSPHLSELAKIGFICAIIALTEAVAVGRSFASIKGYNLLGVTPISFRIFWRLTKIEKLNLRIKELVKEKDEEKERLNGIISGLLAEKEKDKVDKDAMLDTMSQIEAMLTSII
ncbi:putative SLC26A/SulP transporter [Helianthus annuus]|uniref:SLC26A/SulP transporter n=1 Tax=Helianthus annuus TaxID=4232 RepID=A0A9K3MZI9_HELAN|nr:putative SLC26A/SulP transporter [Helianthus annuus]